MTESQREAAGGGQPCGGEHRSAGAGGPRCARRGAVPIGRSSQSSSRGRRL